MYRDSFVQRFIIATISKRNNATGEEILQFLYDPTSTYILADSKASCVVEAFFHF